MRGVTAIGWTIWNLMPISTHTPHAGRDKNALSTSGFSLISTHTPHAGRDVRQGVRRNEKAISTHTPHAGRDTFTQKIRLILEISTHTPHAGRDVRRGELLMRRGFLLTRPMRGVTATFMAIDCINHNILIICPSITHRMCLNIAKLRIFGCESTRVLGHTAFSPSTFY